MAHLLVLIIGQQEDRRSKFGQISFELSVKQDDIAESFGGILDVLQVSH